MKFKKNSLVIHQNRLGLVTNSQCPTCPWSWVDFGNDKLEWHYHVALKSLEPFDNPTIKATLALKLRGIKTLSSWIKGYNFGWICHRKTKEYKNANN